MPVGSNGIDFDSSEGSNPPRLIINYTLPPDSASPTVLQFAINAGIGDPPNLPRGTQPTLWGNQRSDLRTLKVIFSKPVLATLDDIRLTNLGIDANNDVDSIVVLRSDQLELTSNELTIHFNPNELDEGVYQLGILGTLTDVSGNSLDGNGDGTSGDAWTAVGNSENRLYRLRSDFNGDAGVSVFEFSTFSYWFGQDAGPNGPAPMYADMNLDGGVSVFDFTVFSDNFGKGVVFPTALTVARASSPTRQLTEQSAEDVDGVQALPKPTIDWQVGRQLFRKAPMHSARSTQELNELVFGEWDDWLISLTG